MAGIRVRYLDVDGVRTRVLESGPETGRTALLVHGWGASAYSFNALIPALADAGHRAIAFDLPGHGLSDKPLEPARYSTDALADFALRLLQLTGSGPACVVGHSMGAAVGLRMADGHGASVERLVLVGAVGLGRAALVTPVKWLTPGLVDRVSPAMMTRAVVRLVLRFAWGTGGRPSDRDVDEYWAPTQFDEYVRACRACLHRFTWTALADDQLRGIAVPVLVVSGQQDRVVRGVAVRAPLIPGAHVVMVPGGGHIVLQDSSDHVNRAILAFLGVA